MIEQRRAKRFELELPLEIVRPESHSYKKADGGFQFLPADPLSLLVTLESFGGRTLKAAEEEIAGLPSFYRSVFLDDKESVAYTLGQLRVFRRTVQEHGVALAIASTLNSSGSDHAVTS